MLKAGLLPAPVITPNRCDSIGTRLHIDQNTYIEIRCGKFHLNMNSHFIEDQY